MYWVCHSKCTYQWHFALHMGLLVSTCDEIFCPKPSLQGTFKIIFMSFLWDVGFLLYSAEGHSIQSWKHCLLLCQTVCTIIEFTSQGITLNVIYVGRIHRIQHSKVACPVALVISELLVSLHRYKGPVILMAESWKSPKNSWKTGKPTENLRKTTKKIWLDTRKWNLFLATELRTCLAFIAECL